MASGKDVGQPDHDLSQKEIEIITYDMESRLQATVLRIVRPTIDRVADVSNMFSEILDKVSVVEEAGKQTDVLREDIKKQEEDWKAKVASINERLAQIDIIEKRTSDAIQELRTATTELEAKTESSQGEIRKLKIDAMRTSEWVTDLEKRIEEANEKIWAGINANFSHSERERLAIMERVVKLHDLHDKLTEDLYGEGNTIQQINGKISSLQRFVDPLPQAMSDIDRLNLSGFQLDGKLSKCLDTFADVKKEFQKLSERCDKQVNDAREESRVNSNRLVAHHASVMQSIRDDFVEEMKEIKKTRNEATEFQTKSDEFCKEVSRQVVQERERIDAIQRELHEDVENNRKQYQKDRLRLDTDLRDLRLEDATNKQMNHVVRISVDYIARILGLVLESETLSNCMAMQEFADRKSERWLTLSGDSGRRPVPACTPSYLEKQRRNYDVEDREISPLPIDLRKASFAYDTFKPGQVSYQGTSYDRLEILLLHHKLIEKARKAFNTHIIHGAELKAPAKSASIRESIQRQPSATGGTRVTKQKAHQDKMQTDPVEASFHLSDSGSLQPAGSQRQPQALGSRGFVGAGLGQAEPRPDSDAEAARLPEIGIARQPSKDIFVPSVLKLPEIAGNSVKNTVVGKALTAR